MEESLASQLGRKAAEAAKAESSVPIQPSGQGKVTFKWPERNNRQLPPRYGIPIPARLKKLMNIPQANEGGTNGQEK